MLSPTCRWQNWGSERWINMFKGTQFISHKPGIWTLVYWLQSLCTIYISLVPPKFSHMQFRYYLYYLAWFFRFNNYFKLFQPFLKQGCLENNVCVCVYIHYSSGCHLRSTPELPMEHIPFFGNIALYHQWKSKRKTGKCLSHSASLSGFPKAALNFKKWICIKKMSVMYVYKTLGLMVTWFVGLKKINMYCNLVLPSISMS